METGVGRAMYSQQSEPGSRGERPNHGEYNTKMPALSCLFLTSKLQPP